MYADDNIPLKWVFKQNNNPNHATKRTKEWFMKASIRKKCVSNNDELWEAIQNSWNAIPVFVC